MYLRKYKVAKVITLTPKGQGRMNYSLWSARKGSKNKKMKKGTYKVKVKVRALGNSNYKASAWKTVTVRLKVR